MPAELESRRRATPVPDRTTRSALAAVILAIAVAGQAQAASVDNGDFEAGTFAGWTTGQANEFGAWFVTDDTSAPLTGLSIPAPPQGAFAAVTDQSDAGSQILYRDLTLEPGFVGTLNFTWYYNNRASSFATPASLDPGVWPNQQYRIDLVAPAADPFSVAPGDVIASIVATHVGDPATFPPTAVSFDLTPFAGTTVRLRFAAAENQGYFQAGVDAVSVTAPPVPEVPPPASSPAATAECKNGGWLALSDGQGHPFHNQGDCVSWVVSAARRDRRL